MRRAPRSTPEIRVCAANGTNDAPARSGVAKPNLAAASSTIERPSGVSSESDDRNAASASSRSDAPPDGAKASAMRLPKVIVPVLSRSSVSTSPAASTARPEVAITLKRTSRSMPAMPMAERSPPIVVGISVTNSAISTGTLGGCACHEARPTSVTTAIRNTIVSPPAARRARSRSASSAAWRLRRARSCGRRSSRRDAPSRGSRAGPRARACRR